MFYLTYENRQLLRVSIQLIDTRLHGGRGGLFKEVLYIALAEGVLFLSLCNYKTNALKLENLWGGLETDDIAAGGNVLDLCF